MRTLLALLLLGLATLACRPPLDTLRESGRARLEIAFASDSLPGEGGQRTRARIQETLREEIAQALRSELEIVSTPGPPPAPRITVYFIDPVRAEVPSHATDLARSVGGHILSTLTLGLAGNSEENQMDRIGVDRERYRQFRKSHDDSALFQWGPFEKTAKRNRLKELGYTPILLSGRYVIRSADGADHLADRVFFGWETVKHMEPITGHPPTDDEVLRASLRGLARYLRERWSKS